MNGFVLLRNFTEDLEKLLRKKKFVEARDKFESPSRTPSAAQASSSEELAPTLEEEFEEQIEEQAEEQFGGNLAPMFEDMAEKTMREFSTPTTANIQTGTVVNTRENGFELKLALITIVQASQFYGKAHEDSSAHLQYFLEICSIFMIRGVPKDAILLRLFPVLIIGESQAVVLHQQRQTQYMGPMLDCFPTAPKQFYQQEEQEQQPMPKKKNNRNNRRWRRTKHAPAETIQLITALNTENDHMLPKPFPIKRGYLGVPIIECTIKNTTFPHTVCDTRSDCNIMSK